MTTAKTKGPKLDESRVREAMELLDVVARGVARQVGSRFDLDDLKGYAHEAISDVIGKYDSERGVSFRAFARLRLRGAIIDGLRRESGLPRSVAARLRALQASDLYAESKSEENGQKPANAEAADQRVQTFLAGLATAYASGLVTRDDAASSAEEREEVDPEAVTSRKEMRVLIDRALTDIGDPEGTILRRHYFMDEDLQDAAAHVGLSKSWGSRLHARGIEKLAIKLRELRGLI